MRSKEEILEQIKRTAKENRGVALGQIRFEKETGINSYEWGKHFARFGDALKAAGFEPHQFTPPLADQLLIEKIVAVARKLGKFPTHREIEVERRNDPQLPSLSAFKRFGAKETTARKVFQYCEGKTGYQDVVDLCAPLLATPTKENGEAPSDEVGEVYLFKSGHYYKIGKTNDTVRRGTEIRIQLPERVDLIHSIKTDDPSGIEAYWHRRFEPKRMNGEWFDLNTRDIKAFKRWRRIY
jgi:hypothetical protein